MCGAFEALSVWRRWACAAQCCAGEIQRGAEGVLCVLAHVWEMFFWSYYGSCVVKVGCVVVNIKYTAAGACVRGFA